MSKKNQVNGAFFWTTRLKTIPNWQMSQEQYYSTIQLHKNSTSRLDTLQRPITKKKKTKKCWDILDRLLDQPTHQQTNMAQRGVARSNGLF